MSSVFAICDTSRKGFKYVLSRIVDIFAGPETLQSTLIGRPRAATVARFFLVFAALSTVTDWSKADYPEPTAISVPTISAITYLLNPTNLFAVGPNPHRKAKFPAATSL
jgi:hypothetical protein